MSVSKIEWTEHPLIFSTKMVKAIIANQKTQTRRVIKPQPLKYFPKGANDIYKEPEWWSFIYPTNYDSDTHLFRKCPYGQIGGKLYVRESFAYYPDDNHVIYKAEEGEDLKKMGVNLQGCWKPSIHMPKKFARIWLEIINIRVEKVQDITAAECCLEGIDILEGKNHYEAADDAYKKFQILWDSINKNRGFGWDNNPYVWMIEFKRI